MNFTFFLFSFKLSAIYKRSSLQNAQRKKKKKTKRKFRTPQKCTAFTFKKGSEIYIQACWTFPTLLLPLAQTTVIIILI